MNRLLLIPMALFLAGCRSAPQAAPIPPQPPVDPAPVSIARAYSIREPEQLRRVTVNRYVDPGNPNVMHEGHELYVRSQSPTWNTRPNAPLRDELETGKLTVAAPVEAEYALQAEALRESNKQLQQFGDAMIASRKDMIAAIKEIKTLRDEWKKASDADRARAQKLEADIAELKRVVANLESRPTK